MASGCFGCWSISKLDSSTDASNGLSLSVSYYLPQGGAEMATSPGGHAYYVLSGSVLMNGKAEEHLLESGDMIYIAAGEKSAIKKMALIK